MKVEKCQNLTGAPVGEGALKPLLDKRSERLKALQSLLLLEMETTMMEMEQEVNE